MSLYRESQCQDNPELEIFITRRTDSMTTAMFVQSYPRRLFVVKQNSAQRAKVLIRLDTFHHTDLFLLFL